MHRKRNASNPGGEGTPDGLPDNVNNRCTCPDGVSRIGNGHRGKGSPVQEHPRQRGRGGRFRNTRTEQEPETGQGCPAGWKGGRVPVRGAGGEFPPRHPKPEPEQKSFPGVFFPGVYRRGQVLACPLVSEEGTRHPETGAGCRVPGKPDILHPVEPGTKKQGEHPRKEGTP